jgi:hypothetical protein
MLRRARSPASNYVRNGLARHPPVVIGLERVEIANPVAGRMRGSSRSLP